MKTRSHLSLILFITLVTTLVYGQQDSVALETVGPAIKKTSKNHVLQVTGGLTTLSSSISSEAGVAYSLDYFYAYKPQWAAVVSAGQGLNTGLEVLTTDISLGLAYAWKGSHISEKLEIANEGQVIANIDPLPQEAWIITAAIKQNFFNGSLTVLPLTGPSFSLIKRFPSATNQNAIVGGALDYTFNGDNKLTAIRLFVGANFPVF